MPRPPKAPSPLCRVIPSNIDLKQLAIDYPPTFKGKSKFSEERASLILDAMYRASVRAGIKDDNAFIPIPSKFFQSLVYDYHEYLHWLKVAGVIEINEYYVNATVAGAQSQCKGYRFAPTYRTRNKPVITPHVDPKPISQPIVIKDTENPWNGIVEFKAVNPFDVHGLPHDHLSTFNDSYNVRKTPEDPFEQQKESIRNQLQQILRTVTVQAGYEDTIWETNEQSAIERNGILAYLHDLACRKMLMSYSRKSGRIYSSVTQMKREARKYLILNGCDDLSMVDVRTCHPYLMIHVANKVREANSRIISQTKIDEWTMAILEGDVDLYSGMVYAFADWNGTVQNRDYWKEIIQRIFNGPIKQTHTYNGRLFTEKVLFQELFPEMMRVVNYVKRTPTKQSERLSNLLTHIEAEIMLYKVCPRLFEERIDVLTVHDAVVVPSVHAIITQQIIEDEFRKVVGVEPKMKIVRYQDPISNTLPQRLLPPHIQEYYDRFWEE